MPHEEPDERSLTGHRVAVPRAFIKFALPAWQMAFEAYADTIVA
jgi:hypothetical protein